MNTDVTVMRSAPCQLCMWRTMNLSMNLLQTADDIYMQLSECDRSLLKYCLNHGTD